MEYFRSFIVGGFICLIAQILIDKTKIMPARILVSYVIIGATLSAVGIYEKIVKFAECGATVPIIGFGHCLVKGVRKSVEKEGLLGVLTGGTREIAAGITSSIFFALVISLIFSPKEKNKL